MHPGPQRGLAELPDLGHIPGGALGQVVLHAVPGHVVGGVEGADGQVQLGVFLPSRTTNKGAAL